MFAEAAPALAEGVNSAQKDQNLEILTANLSTALELWDAERASCLSEWHKADAGVSKAKALSGNVQKLIDRFCST